MSGSWPDGTSPPPPLLLVQATNNQLFLNLDQGQDLSQLNHHLRQQGSLGGGGEEKVGRVTLSITTKENTVITTSMIAKTFKGDNDGGV